MRAAIRRGVLGYTVSFSNNQVMPAFDPETKNINDVFVKVNAAAINPIDYKMPRAVLGPVYGHDFCGTIEKLEKILLASSRLEMSSLESAQVLSQSMQLPILVKLPRRHQRGSIPNMQPCRSPT